MTTRSVGENGRLDVLKIEKKECHLPTTPSFFLIAARITGQPACQLSQLPCRWLTVFMQVSRAPGCFISRLFATRRFRTIGTVLGGPAVTNRLQTGESD